MKLKLTSMLIATIISPSVFSEVNVYKDERNSMSVGGFIDVRIINTQNQTEIVNGTSRINFKFDRELKQGWTALGRVEWGVNPVGSSDIVYNNRFESIQDEFLYNRLGYAGISHEKYGQITIGKQWGAWYDVVYGTNNSFVWDGNAAGVYTYNKDDGAVNGTGRGDKLIQYRNSYNDLSLTLQAQLKNSEFYTCDVSDITEYECETLWNTGDSAAQEVEFNYTFGASVTYTPTDMLTLTAGVNRGEFDLTYGDSSTQNVEDLIYGAGIMWGSVDQKGLYVAANINKNKNHDTDNLGRLIKDAMGVETFASYRFDNDFRPIIAYNVFDAGDGYVIQPNFNADPNDVFKRQFAVIGLHYLFDEDTIAYVEARKDFSDFESNNKDQQAQMEQSEDDGIAFGFRYQL
ncbi:MULTISPECIES: porin [unclassified Pseudoalteromonas]|uniref:porin n=1 Tax=unclassified Pseudoalteromonas TaxID=194690 RepID=UPI001109F752|nr:MULTISPECIES: porin [unclassified Pseudoalteromonas]TMN82901.1 porin [Pseudoalteromonas sp. S410]TMN90285.1 porin [Pseudoalteromonas sp. S408]TMO00847.1 porin [Pseudoalteromonas sp. S407]TMO01964.1 porin [Pseudoalteromonas sp. S409]TMO12288.1 porin [Pseudoalteromonas sp. S186]